ncbi:MAG: SprT family zinc-dependent metalloprotease [Pseudomonadota bacterium]
MYVGSDIVDIDAPVTVRESKRARRPSLTVNRRGLEVVLPQRFPRESLAAFLHQHRDWIARTIDRARDEFDGFDEGGVPALPNELDLKACNARFAIEYVAGTSQSNPLSCDGATLTVVDSAGDVDRICGLLREFTKAFARDAFTQHVASLSEETGLPYSRITVRGQRTRWGSYSPSGSLSLNYKLLFLPAALYRHVLLHELCHSRYLNHSAGFWRLLRSFDPDTDAHNRALRRGDRYIPEWVDYKA